MDPGRRGFLCSLAGCAGGWLLGGPARAEDALPGGGPPAGPHADERPRLPTADSAHVREAYHYTQHEDRGIECGTCPHRCVLEPGEVGFCRAKANLGGRHYSLSYGNPCSVHVDPVEKKPLLHYLPGSQALSLAVAGCNFRCLNCQNWEISQVTPMETENYDLPPPQVVAHARKYDCRSIAFTYSEPTSFYEYALDTAEQARDEGVGSIWVSNGYIRPEPLERLSRAITAASINLKSYEDRIYRELNGGRLQPVLDTLVTLKRNGVWLEVIHLLIPTWTDDFEMIRRMCGWFVTTLGPGTPLHFSRFEPRFRLNRLPPTPAEALVRAREIARAEGIHHVYIGNVPGLAENTFCPACRHEVIERRGYRIVKNDLRDGACGRCGERIAGVWS